MKLRLVHFAPQLKVAILLSAASLAACEEPTQVGASGEVGASSSQALVPTSPAIDAVVKRKSYLDVLEKARSRGHARVIVQLNTPFAPEPALAAEVATGQRQRIKGHQSAILTRLGGHRPTKVKTFEYSPLLALEGDAATLETLAALPEVAFIAEDTIEWPLLAESVPHIETARLMDAGDNGVGQTIAVLDTGVDGTHPDLSGKVVSEACYSGTFCPGGTSSTAPGSGIPCTGVGICRHGTMVAGVAAGFKGVASQSSIIPIQVFTRFDSEFFCGTVENTPCIGAQESDVITALERVFALRNTFSIAAANLSFGGGSNNTPCDFDPRKSIIDSLRSANIPAIIAWGNTASPGGTFSMGIASPACISTAVSVGSVNDSTGASGFDEVASSSQTATFLSLLAPGEAITLPIPGGGYETTGGTSMAAPHVSGAWALMRARRRDATVTQVLADLRSTGTVGSVADAKPNLALNRPVTSSGNTCHSSEAPDRAVNGSGFDKWCAFGANQWLRVDLGGLRSLRAFTIKHAGAGSEESVVRRSPEVTSRQTSEYEVFW